MPALPEAPKKASSKYVQTSAKLVPFEEAPLPRRDPRDDPREDRDFLRGSGRQRPEPADALQPRREAAGDRQEVKRYVLREISTQTDTRLSDRQLPARPEPLPRDRSRRPSQAPPRLDSSVEDANDSLERSPPMRPKVSSVESSPEDAMRRPSHKVKDPVEAAPGPRLSKSRKNSVSSKQTRRPGEDSRPDARGDRAKRSASLKRESQKQEARTRQAEEYDTGDFKIKPEKLAKPEKLDGSREASRTHKKPFEPKLPSQGIRELITAQRSHSRKQADVIRALEEEKESLKQLISKMIVENRRTLQAPTREQKSPEPRYMSPIGHKHRHPSEEREAEPKNKQPLRSPPRKQSAAVRSPDSTGNPKKPLPAAERPQPAAVQTNKPPRTKSRPRDSEEQGFASPQKTRPGGDAPDRLDKPGSRRRSGPAFGASSPPRSPTRKSPFDVHDSKTEWDRTGHLLNRFEQAGADARTVQRYHSDERGSPAREERGERCARVERQGASPPRAASAREDSGRCEFGFRHAPVRQKCSDVVFEGTLYHLHR